MKILHLTRQDFAGAPARAATALHRELTRLGHDSEMLTAIRQTDTPGVGLLEKKPTPNCAMFKSVQEQEFDENISHNVASFFTLGYPGVSIGGHPAVQKADVIHLHDVKDFLSPMSLGSLVRAGKKIVWSMTDAWSFTGGCHAPLNCENFTSDCRNCPQLSEDGAALPAGVLADKLDNYGQGNFSLVAPNQWLASSLVASLVHRRHSIQVVPPALDRNIFRERDKSVARQRLEIPEKAFVLLIRAEHAAVRKRGYQCIEEFIEACPHFHAFQRLARVNELVVIILGLSEEMSHPSIPIKCWTASDPEHLGLILGCADLVALPHVEENSGSLVLESAFFQTPVVAFDTMGMREHIEEGRTGMLIPNWEPRRMAEAVSLLALRPAKLEEWSRQCRRFADAQCDMTDQARRYLEIYATAFAADPVPERESSLSMSPVFFSFFWDYANSTQKEPSTLKESVLAADAATGQMKRVLERSSSKIALMERRLARFKNASGEVVSEDFTKAFVSLQKLQGTFAKTLRRHESMLRQENGNNHRSMPVRKNLLPATATVHVRPQAPLPPFLEKKLITFVTTRLNKAYGKGIGTLEHYPPRPLRLEKFPKPSLARRDLPTIAIVTPSYMQGHFIEKTISSITDQKYPKLRYAVQDAGSTDDTISILQRRAKELTVWSSLPDTGQARAICEGFEKINGNVMAWLNSDDTLLPGSLRYVAEYFRRHPDVDVVYGHRVLINEHDQEVCRWVLPPHDPELLDRVDYVPQETLFWRRELWNKVGGIDPKFRFAMDWDLLLRFSKAGAKIVRLPYFLGCFRVHSEQKTSAAMNTIGAEEIAHLRVRTLGRLPDSSELGGVHRSVRKRSALYEFLLRLGVRL